MINDTNVSELFFVKISFSILTHASTQLVATRPWWPYEELNKKHLQNNCFPTMMLHCLRSLWTMWRDVVLIASFLSLKAGQDLNHREALTRFAALSWSAIEAPNWMGRKSDWSVLSAGCSTLATFFGASSMK